MSTKYFNFNNEQDLTPVEYNDETGVVTFSLEGETMDFASLNEFAEFYATARNVVPENLKNWVMTEEGNQFAFVLAAGTAGLTADEINNLVQGLHNAGMSPEEIGRAVASATNAPVENNEGQQESLPTGAGMVALASAWYEDTTDVTKALLRAYYGQQELSAAVQDLYNDTTLQDDFDEIQNDINEELDEEEDEDDYNYGVVTDGEIFNRVMEDALNTTRASLSDRYPGVPIKVAVDIELDTLANDEEAYKQLHHAVFAAKIARRELEVTVVAKSDGVVVEHKFYDDGLERNLETNGATYAFDEGCFVVLVG